MRKFYFLNLFLLWHFLCFSQENKLMFSVEGLYYPKTKSFPASDNKPFITKGLQARAGYIYGESGTVGILGNITQQSISQKNDSSLVKGFNFAVWQRNEANIADLFNTYYEFQLGYKSLNIKVKGGYFAINGGVNAEILPHIWLDIWANLFQYQLTWDSSKEVHKDLSLGSLLGGGFVCKF